MIQVYGFTKENIFVHYYEGFSNFGNDLDDPEEPSYDIDYPAHEMNIQQTFLELAGVEDDLPEIPILTPDDQLFVFVTGHGYTDEGNSTIWFDADEEIFDYELAGYMADIDCAQMIFLMSQCYSGGFMDDLINPSANFKCQNRSFHSAANDQESSWAEEWLTGGGYDEFLYYWNAAARGFYPITDEPWTIPSDWVTGQAPLQNYIPNHPGDYTPDQNDDGFIQMEEAFDYANYMDTWSNGEDGFYQPFNGNEIEHPQNVNDIGFIHNGTDNADILSIAGYAGMLNEDVITEPLRSYVMGGSIQLTASHSLTLSSYSVLNFVANPADLIIQPDAELIIEDDVALEGNTDNSVLIEGNIFVGEDVSFERTGSSGYFNGLNLINHVLYTDLNLVTFNHAGLNNYGNELNITNSTFNYCPVIHSFRGNILVGDHSNFTETSLSLKNLDYDNSTATVSECSFSGSGNLVAIDIWDYDNFFVEYNSIDGYYYGVQIAHSGEGIAGHQSVFDNEISGCTYYGALIYNSTVSIAQNHIYDNYIGVSLQGRSNIALYGNPGAQSYEDVNFITDNDVYEVYSSQYSFPWYFKYNALIDEDNTGNPVDPMLYYSTGVGLRQVDAKYNCWGHNFNASQDLYPVSAIAYNPVWCPGDPSHQAEVAEQMYLAGKTYFDEQQFDQASTSFHLLIDQFPESIYAEAAMKDLFTLEKYLTNDFQDLKNYFENNDNIQSDPTLQNLSRYLINECDIQLENYPGAISFYENIISDPPTIDDSVYAIIDLGYLYLFMENNGSRFRYTGNLSQYKPKSSDQYLSYRDYLLSLLPGVKEEQKQNPNYYEVKNGMILRIIPNPFKDRTRIIFEIGRPAKVDILVEDLTGKKLCLLKLGQKDKGTYYNEFFNNGLAPGTYLMSLILDESRCDTKKVNVIY